MKTFFLTVLCCLFASFFTTQCTVKILDCYSIEASIIDEVFHNPKNYAYTLEQELLEGVWKSVAKTTASAKKIIFSSLKQGRKYRVTCVLEKSYKNSLFTKLSSYQNVVRKDADGFVSNPVYLNNCTSKDMAINAQKSMGSNVKIFPNPVSDLLMISQLKGENNVIRFFDLQGKLMLTAVTDLLSTKIDISLLPKGIYFIKIEQDKILVSNHKVIVL